MLVEEASKIASTYSDVFTATILDVEKCKELKMCSCLGVAIVLQTHLWELQEKVGYCCEGFNF